MGAVDVLYEQVHRRARRALQTGGFDHLVVGRAHETQGKVPAEGQGWREKEGGDSGAVSSLGCVGRGRGEAGVTEAAGHAGAMGVYPSEQSSGGMAVLIFFPQCRASVFVLINSRPSISS